MLQTKNNYVLLSGGMDSGTLLAAIQAQTTFSPGAIVKAVSITYPSKHNAHERRAAAILANHLGVELIPVDLSSIFDSFSSALLESDSRAIPEGHYEAENMRQTVVPLRNLIFLSVIAGKLMSLDQSDFTLFIGVHAGDHAIYPDCRFGTMRAFTQALYEGSDRQVILQTPFINMDKTGIVKLGIEIGVPYELTHTCYTNSFIACGKCGSCTERLEAFKNNGIKDPIEYLE